MTLNAHAVSRILVALTLSVGLSLPACGGDDNGSDGGTGGTPSTGGTNAGGSSSTTGGKGGSGGAPGSKGGSAALGGGASVGGAGVGGATGAGGSSSTDPAVPDEYGFLRRVPSQRDLTCTGAYENQVQIPDTDWICTFEDAQGKGVVYFQSTPVSCRQVLSAVATFQTVGWLSRNGAVTKLSSAAYDWGGNHHNDALDFEVDGVKYGYYHSSFGWGWCQNMDCARIYASDGTTVQTDGCTHERTMPIVCSAIEADDTAQPLEDHFATCLGDPNG
jgi:hypothetical protein